MSDEFTSPAPEPPPQIVEEHPDLEPEAFPAVCQYAAQLGQDPREQ